MSGTSAGWTKERRAAHSAFMVALNRDPEFIARRRKGHDGWTQEQREAKAAQMRALNSDPDFRARRAAGNAKRLPRGFSSSLPKHVHPIVRGLFAEMNEQRAPRKRVAGSAGLTKHTLSSWRRSSMPLLDTIDAALNTLDLELAIVPIGTRDQNGFARKKNNRNQTTGDQQ
jgi:hypothetical protein